MHPFQQHLCMRVLLPRNPPLFHSRRQSIPRLLSSVLGCRCERDDEKGTDSVNAGLIAGVGEQEGGEGGGEPEGEVARGCSRIKKQKERGRGDGGVPTDLGRTERCQLATRKGKGRTERTFAAGEDRPVSTADTQLSSSAESIEEREGASLSPVERMRKELMRVCGRNIMRTRVRRSGGVPMYGFFAGVLLQQGDGQGNELDEAR